MNIYHELTNDDDSEKILLTYMKTAAKLCNRSGNRSLLEIQLNESMQILDENEVLKDVGNKLVYITQQSLKEPDYFVKPNKIVEQENPTYH
ncbi:MAG: hypothetical protein PF569_05975 [Candidatus Woesearchaeota archaeon]|nr:hypothetical protein [Candidatus Woesearchaeota archaeon]